MTKQSASETSRDLREQLNNIAKEYGCTPIEAVCILDGVIKAALELAIEYKLEARKERVAARAAALS